MIEAVKNVLSNLRFGEPQSHETIVILPILGPAGAAFDYITLTDALEARWITVTEVSQGGSVPELKVVNTGDRPILLLDGEELVGAKQNRVLNTSILMPEKQTVVIPVSCTEQGRWSYTSAAFSDSGTVMARQARARKVRSVSSSLEASAGYMSDQGEVWDSIEELHEASGVHSPTLAMKDVYEARKGQIEEALKAFVLVNGQTGLLAVMDGEVVGFDVLSSASAYARLHPKLVKSYVMDSVFGKKSAPSGTEARQKAADFIARLSQCEEKTFKSVGHGDDHRYTSGRIVGSALVCEGAVIHAAFFQFENEMSPMSGIGRRRAYRTQ